jgi:hypothetical protein
MAKTNLLCKDLHHFVKDKTNRWYVINGIYYGYPLCCIKNFCERGYKLTKDQREISDNHFGFVPCPKCAKKILQKELDIIDLIKDRICEKPFPEDEC